MTRTELQAIIDEKIKTNGLGLITAESLNSLFSEINDTVYDTVEEVEQTKQSLDDALDTLDNAVAAFEDRIDDVASEIKEQVDDIVEEAVKSVDSTYRLIITNKDWWWALDAFDADGGQYLPYTKLCDHNYDLSQLSKYNFPEIYINGWNDMLGTVKPDLSHIYTKETIKDFIESACLDDGISLLDFLDIVEITEEEYTLASLYDLFYLWHKQWAITNGDDTSDASIINSMLNNGYQISSDAECLIFLAAPTMGNIFNIFLTENEVYICNNNYLDPNWQN